MASCRLRHFSSPWPAMVTVPLETGPLSEPPVKVALALRPFFLKSPSASREYATTERRSRICKLLALVHRVSLPVGRDAARLTQAG